MNQSNILSEKVGEGTYGCVFNPSLKCKNLSINYENKISKVMTTTEALKELKEFNSINKIEGLQKFAITSPLLCYPIVDDNYINSIKQCKNPLISKINIKYPDHSMLIYQDGGINIHNYIRKIMNKSSKNDIIIFLTSLTNLLDGLLFFNSKDIIHRDIKSDNIVYNINTGQIRFIDFGLMIKKSRALNLSKKSADGFAIDHSYWPPENFCRNLYSYDNLDRCAKYKNKYEYNIFLNMALNSFDLYTLSLVFFEIAKKLISNSIFKTFSTKLIELLDPYILKDITERSTDINKLKFDYIELLKKYNYYVNNQEPTPTNKIKEKVEELHKEEIKKDIKKKECVPPKPIYNHITNRCIMECKNGYVRDENFKCIRNKGISKKTKQHKTSRNKKSISKTKKMPKKLLCPEKNMDYNHITNRCNKKCKPNQIRDSNFKCIKRPLPSRSVRRATRSSSGTFTPIMY
mgnify:CR=1 FL=1|tara:strand:+ start:843 stop:2225 length:1383 start_codon:yes stop_codon:yes gene_type:complete